MSEQDATPGFEPQARGVEEGPELVGAADAQADAIRSGADEDVPPDEVVARDSDGEPIGRADLAADKAPSGEDRGEQRVDADEPRVRQQDEGIESA